MRIALVVLVVALSGCGGDDCQEPYGLYSVNWLERSGNCGDIPNTTVSTESDPNSECVTKESKSEDSCSVSVDMTCPAGSLLMEGSGDVTWAEDGLSADGTLSMTFYSSPGVVYCSGTYDVTYTQI